jgi:hypothetical protein
MMFTNFVGKFLPVFIFMNFHKYIWKRINTLEHALIFTTCYLFGYSLFLKMHQFLSIFNLSLLRN